jgi:hypothetical protein
VVTVPLQFESDLRAGRNAGLQLSIDATAMQQAGIGSSHIKKHRQRPHRLVPPAHGHDRVAAHQPGGAEPVQSERRVKSPRPWSNLPRFGSVSS